MVAGVMIFTRDIVNLSSLRTVPKILKTVGRYLYWHNDSMSKPRSKLYISHQILKSMPYTLMILLLRPSKDAEMSNRRKDADATLVYPKRS